MSYQMVKLSFTCSVMVVCVCVLLSSSLYGQDNADPLTPEERNWLTNHDGKIILAHDPDAKPVDYLDEHGEFKGLAADYVALLEQRLNFTFHIVHLQPWSEIVQKAKNREIDVLCSFTRNPEREEWMLFTDPYITIKVVILTRKDFQGSLTLDTMKDMRVAYTQGWIVDDYLNAYNDTIIRVPAADDTAAMNFLLTGDADAWITALTVASLRIEENKVTNLRVAGETDLAFHIAFASRKDWPILNSILQKGLALITEHEREEIFNKWIHINVKGQMSKQVIFGISLFILIIILLLVVVLGWNRMLQRMVNTKTQELQQELEERRQAQRALSENREFLNSIIHNSTSVIYVKDPDGKYVLINTHYEHLFHVTNDQIQGKTDYDIFPKQIADILIKNDQDVIQHQQSLEFEERILHDTREYIYLSVKFPIYHAEGQILGVCGISTDITERKKIEEELHHHRAHLEELVSERTAALQAANEELESFAYITSHDLKAPLRAISRLAQWLIEDYADVLDEHGKEMAELLIQRVQRMDNFIEGILEYSRIGRIIGQREPVNLNHLVTEVIDTLAPPKHITVTLENELPVLSGDRIRLMQVFQNLIGNAVKFLDNSSGDVRIGCISEESQWKFWVADNGPGIEERHYERIFQIFQTLTPRDEQENTGVGLAIVKKIVEFYHGKIWVESTVGKGATFFFLLPKNGNTA